MTTKPEKQLFWHLATYNNGQVSMAAPYHTIIATSCIEVTHDSTVAWFKVGDNPSELVRATDIAFSSAYHLVTFTGTNFGLPVLISNAFISGTPIDTTLQKLGDDLISHTDLAKTLQQLTNPEGFMGFDLMCRLCGLPKRIDLDVAAAWTSPDPKMKKRIGRRLLTDVALIALGYSKWQFVSNVWDKAQTQQFNQRVIAAVAEKAKIATKMFC